MGARHFGMKEESTWPTEVVPDLFFEALSESVQKEINFETIEVVRQFSPIDIAELTTIVRGDLEILSNYNGMPILYDQLLGSHEFTTDTPESGFNRFEFPATAGIPAADRIGKSFTGEFRRDGSLVWRYAGLKIVSLSHSFGIDQSSRMSIGVMGVSENQTTTFATATYPTVLPLQPKQIAVSFDGTGLKARSVTIEIENPLDEAFILGQTTMGVEPDRSGVLKVTGTAEILFDSVTEYAKFDGSTNVTVVVVATNVTHKLTYNMNKCRLTQATPHVTGRERLIATYEWESFFDATATENLQVVIDNQDANLP